MRFFFFYQDLYFLLKATGTLQWWTGQLWKPCGSCGCIRRCLHQEETWFNENQVRNLLQSEIPSSVTTMAEAIVHFSPTLNWFCLSTSGCRIVIYFAGNICSLRSFPWLPVVEANLCVYPQAKQGSDTRRLSCAHSHASEPRLEGEELPPWKMRGDPFSMLAISWGALPRREKKKTPTCSFLSFHPFFLKKEHQSYHSCFLTIIPQILMYVSQSFHAKSTSVYVFYSI